MLKKMLVSFEKKVKKNQEMRIKYSDNPEKYGLSYVLTTQCSLTRFSVKAIIIGRLLTSLSDL